MGALWACRRCSDEWNANHTVTNALDKTGDTMTGALAITSGTLTASAPALDISQTWNAGAVAFTGAKLNITATACDAASKIIDVQLGGVSKLSMNFVGGVLIGQYLMWSNPGAYIDDNSSGAARMNGDWIIVRNSGNLGFYDATPVAKPTVTGSRGGNAALASLLTQLATLGLITDSSS